jgi:hypothetical protein
MTAREWKRHGAERRREAGLVSAPDGLGPERALDRSE